MDERFYELAAIEFVVTIGVMHLEVMELELGLTHFTRIDGHFGMFSDVPAE